MTATRDKLIAAAQSLPDLIAAAKDVDPQFAASLTSKPLLASKTPWGTLAGGLIAWGAARYGFNLSAGDVELISGLGVLVGGYAMRYVTSGPIGSVLPPKAP